MPPELEGPVKVDIDIFEIIKAFAGQAVDGNLMANDAYVPLSAEVASWM